MAQERKYELIEHTADIGIKVEAPTLPQLFANAAAGMFHLLCPSGAVGAEARESIAVEAGGYEELLVNWLTELLFLFDAQRLIFNEFQITQLDDHHLTATVRGEKYSPDRHELDHDIKAVTYYGLQVRRERTNWTASIVFDV
jgi:SHS2 domain-containing protein